MNPVAELTEAQRVVIIDPNELPTLDKQLLPLIAKGCEWSNGQFSPQGVVDGVLGGRYRLLAYLDRKDILSIAVLSVTQCDTGMRILEVLLASGAGLHDWRKFQPDVAAYGKAHGCVKFRMCGREGLQRMLPDWKRVGIILEKAFD